MVNGNESKGKLLIRLTTEELVKRIRPDFEVLLVGAAIPDQCALDVVLWRQGTEAQTWLEKTRKKLISLTSSFKFLVSTHRCGSANHDNELRKRLVTFLQSRLTWVGADERLMQLPFGDAWIECSEEHNHAHGHEGG